jgi:ABC-type multidrug transport system permease subunit
MGGLLVFPIWDVTVQCKESEFGVFDPPSGETCGNYMAEFLSQNTGYINNPDATSGCQYCGYSKGSEYLASINLPRHVYGWRDICLTLLFCISSYALVFLLL